jgi:predicted CXXCH cytochrome family protein
MRKIFTLGLCTMVAACAARQLPPPSGRALAQLQQAEAMRRAPQTARSQRALTGSCAIKEDLSRSMTTSSYCLSCHDGTHGSAVADHTHPVSFRYDPATARTALRWPTADGIVLVSGTSVECTSCHDPASKLPSFTALTLDRSTLCLGCHLH